MRLHKQVYSLYVSQTFIRKICILLNLYIYIEYTTTIHIIHRRIDRVNMHLAFLLVVLCFIVIVPETTSMNWLKFGWCVGGDMYTCSGRMLKARYREMQTANCKNCDKFFHCKGNFDAVYRCGESAEARRIAKKS